MSNRERSDIPNWVLTGGEKVQTLAKKIQLDWLIKPFTGSSSPNYVQAEWHRVDQIVDPYSNEEPVLPVAFGDPDASLLAVISRFKRQAAVLGSSMYEVRSLVEDNHGTAGIGFSYRGQTRVGILPRGELEFSIDAETLRYQTAIRMGRNDVGATIAIWLPGERVLLKPRDALVIAQNLPLDELGERFTHTPLV